MDEESEGGVVPDQEKKIRREIANSNERRRMQSINAGFQSLRTLLPHHEGEKLSKAAILQQTAEYIYSLEQEKTRLLAQNCQLKRLLSLSQQQVDTLQQEPLTPKRKRGQKEAKAGSEEAQSTSAGTGGAAAATAGSSEQPTEPEIPAALPIPIVEEQVESCSTEDTNVVLLSCEKREDSSLVLSKPLMSVIETVDGAIRVRLEPINTEQAAIKQEQDVREEENSERSYIVTSNSKQNLDSIVEAIRHLEGDHLFAEDQNVVTHQVFGDDVVQRIALKQSENSIIIVEKHVK